MKLKSLTKRQARHLARIAFWFLVGAGLATFLISGFAFIIFQKSYAHLVYPGVYIDGVDFSGKNQEEVKNYYIKKNQKIENTIFVFNYKEQTATVSAKGMGLGFNQDLMSAQALSIGRSSDPISNASIIAQAYLAGVSLSPSYHFSQNEVEDKLKDFRSSIDKGAVDALFQFENGRVTAFRPSSSGQKVSFDKLGDVLLAKMPSIFSQNAEALITIVAPVEIIQPNVSTDKANNLGIRELIGEGTSLFAHSIPERIYNVTLGAARINGILVAPGDIFSFDKALGDVSSFTGYKQAYVIQNGKTVLGDGGGVCQVSTTFFRALLNAGLPITERTAHAYRVGYYEEDSPPGIDATIYVPSVDLKFKNDTGNYILIQTAIDPSELRLTISIYGTKDDRSTTLSKPVVSNQVAPPPPSYQDDPTLPSGTVKQVDFEAWGADVYFTREVRKDGKVIISEKYTSNYRPWQAVFLKGSK